MFTSQRYRLALGGAAIVTALFLYRDLTQPAKAPPVLPTPQASIPQEEHPKMSFAISTMTLAGTRGSYSLNIDPDANVSAIPTGGGSAITGTGIGLIQFSDVGIYILNNTQAQVALLYEAALGREPDSGGLATWVNIYDTLPTSVQAAGVYTSLADTSGGFNGSLSIADGFIDSAEFQSKYGSLSNQQYITQLYANVLHRTPDQGGMDTWMAALTPTGQSYTDPTSGQTFAGQGQTRAYVLVGFAESTENIADCAVTATTTSTAGWLVNTTTQGAYADAGALLSPQAAVAAAAENGILNASTTSAAAVAVGPSGVYNAEFAIGNQGTYYWAATNATGVTLDLSSAINHAFVGAAGDIINSYSGGGSNIDLSASSSPILNTTINLVGGHNLVATDQYLGQYNSQYYAAAQSTTITGYQPGSDALGLPAIDNLATVASPYVPSSSIGYPHLPISILTPTLANQVSGSTLNFTQNSYVINLGNVGDGSLSSIAAAANAVYKVADTNGVSTGTTAASAAGENLTFIGTTTTGNTVIAQWADFSSANINGQLVPQHSADVNGNHQIDASELVQLFTLVGVQASSLTAADFH